LLKCESGKKHKIQLAKFDKASLGVIWFRRRPLLGCSHIEMSRHQITGSNGPAAVIMRPAISNVEFSQLFEFARVLVRLDQIASRIVNANHRTISFHRRVNFPLSLA